MPAGVEGSPAPTETTLSSRNMELFNDTRPHFETGEGRKTVNNMAPHKLLRAGDTRWLFSKDGEPIFILEHQLILLRWPLLDPSEQILHVSCTAGATPSVIWADTQTYIPAHNGQKAEGEKGFSDSTVVKETDTSLGVLGSAQSHTNVPLCRTISEGRDSFTVLTNMISIYLN